MNKSELLNQLGVEELQSLVAVAIKDMVKKEWLNPDDLVEEYGISIHSQNRLRMEKKIPYSKIGKLVKYKRSEIDRWIESHAIPVKGA